jgi:Iap family predicted aminopeptidase
VLVVRTLVGKTQGKQGLCNYVSVKSLYYEAHADLPAVLDGCMVELCAWPILYARHLSVADTCSPTHTILQVSTARPGQAAKAPKRAPANWKNKHVIIDAINDLIDELENITTSITVQVRQAGARSARQPFLLAYRGIQWHTGAACCMGILV